MSRWHNHYVDGAIHFCTSSVQDWQPRLDERATRMLYEEWGRARHALGVRVLAFVVMPDHIHLLVHSETGQRVMEFLQRIMGRTSKRIGHGGKFWKERLRVLPLWSGEPIRTKLDYIHRNPLTRGLATNPNDYVHSSHRQLVLRQADVPFTCDEWPEGVQLPVR